MKDPNVHAGAGPINADGWFPDPKDLAAIEEHDECFNEELLKPPAERNFVRCNIPFWNFLRENASDLYYSFRVSGQKLEQRIRQLRNILISPLVGAFTILRELGWLPEPKYIRELRRDLVIKAAIRGDITWEEAEELLEREK